MSKKKKKKQKDNKPQLSKLDKAIYFLFALFTMGICFGSFYQIEYIKSVLFFANPDILAFQDRMTTLWCLPLFLVILIIIISIWDATYGKRKAIFGNKKVDYTKHNYQFYPIFYKGKKPKRKMTDDRKMEIKISIILWLIAYIIAFSLTGLSIFGRTVLTKDGQVIKYTIFNNIKEQYYVSDISEVEYTTYLHNVAKGSDYYTYAIKLHLKNSDDYFIFEYENFDRTNKQSFFTTSLDDMKYLRDTVYRDKKITYNKEVSLEQVIKNKRMTQEEIEKLYEFFSENKK